MKYMLKMVRKMNPQEAYLLGLICARGHLFESGNKIVIEFAHKNKTITGIAHCHKCGYIATKRDTDNPEGHLYCKSCGAIVKADVKRVYEQKESTLESIDQVIIPFLSEIYDAKYSVVGNDHMTLLVLELKEIDFCVISGYFDGKTSFDSFVIPRELSNVDLEVKKEFVGGLLDAAGFFNAGGWLPRAGKKNYGRMRAYFQIVRNWEMPVQICNFLKKELGLPVHTIDWGHPNIRDSNMTDYYNSNPLSWSREHQLKFFPEYYQSFPIRIEHKKEMFNELIDHNISAEFVTRDDCSPPSPVSINKVKAYHHGENDSRIPESTRKHCDAYWQVCHNMGCIFSNELIMKSNNVPYYYLIGKNERGDFNSKDRIYDTRRRELTKRIVAKNRQKEVAKQQKAEKVKRTNPEQKLYDPISKWLEKYLSEKYKEKVLVHDTSAYYLDRFISQNNLFEEFEFCDNYKIKPDIVGFLLDSKEVIFAEVKIGALTIQNIGQLLGYSLVGMPKLSMLISPEKSSINLMKILEANPQVLHYGEESIELGYWDGERCIFVGE